MNKANNVPAINNREDYISLFYFYFYHILVFLAYY